MFHLRRWMLLSLPVVLTVFFVGCVKIVTKYGTNDVTWRRNTSTNFRNSLPKYIFWSKNATPTVIGNRNAGIIRSNGLIQQKRFALCPTVSPRLGGRLDVRAILYDLAGISSMSEVNSTKQVQFGGRYQPLFCKSREITAVIIPSHKRDAHLRVALLYLHEVLQRQQLEYRIFVVDFVSTTFNKGMALNIGYLTASKLQNHTCYVMHDVDKLPEDDRNLYRCQHAPVLLSPLMSVFNYRYPYKGYFGGVVAFKPDQFEKINGYSNMYFGWGGEDDDSSKRIFQAGMKFQKRGDTIGRFYTPPHKRDSNNPYNPERVKFLKTARKRMRKDGLNTVEYETLKIEERTLYTYIYAEVNENKIKQDCAQRCWSNKKLVKQEVKM